MHALVIVILAVALGAVVIAGGLWSLSGSGIESRPLAVRVQAGAAAIEAAARAARTAGGAGWPQGGAVFDAAGWAAWPGASGRPRPEAPAGLLWSYEGAGAAAWACLSGPAVDAAALRALRVAAAADPARATVSAGCGTADAPAPVPGPAALTVRFAKPPAARPSAAVVAGNAPPAAGAPAAATARDSRLDGAGGALLDGAADPDGDALAVVPAAGTSERGGSFAVRSDGGFAYTPPAGWSGADGFPFRLVDGRGGSAVGRAAVTVGP